MNQLQFEKSPYLLQHAENPVNWRPWSRDAFADARREDKPVFLSIGYSTCHWCHVMAHESFEAEDVAEILNRDYISVKVDREERPDVDAVYMSACMAVSGSGGWPLTLLLTPEQKPFWAGTYLPKHTLMSLLRQASRLWREDRASLLQTGEALTEYLRHEEATSNDAPSPELVKIAVESFSRQYDPKWGGFGPAPKFPTPHNLLFLLRYAGMTGDAPARNMAEGTLQHMYRGGIFDHVSGGFSRYSTDERWLIPHFEKTLYDNALLTMAYTEAYAHTKRPVYRLIAHRTLDYVLEELAGPQGGFCCGQDADSDGVEGKYYVFTKEEILRELGDGAGPFCKRFGVADEGNFDGKSVLNLIDAPDWERESEEITSQLQRLRAYRAQRTALHRDDKVLTAWNGLTIAALAQAGLYLDEPGYWDAALCAIDVLERHLRDPRGNLLARWRDGDAAHPGKLEDYAFYAWGLLELYGVTFHAALLKRAIGLADTLLNDFFDSEHGGFYPYSASGEQLIARTKDAYDGALPSGNAVAALVLSRLGRLTGEARWRDAAELQYRYLAGVMGDYPTGHGFALLGLLEELWPTEEIVCAAREIPSELTEYLRDNPLPGRTVLVKTPDNADALAAVAPFSAGYPIPETGAQYYRCRDGACDPPVEDVGAL